jgi:hypothetical protein
MQRPAARCAHAEATSAAAPRSTAPTQQLHLNLPPATTHAHRKAHHRSRCTPTLRDRTWLHRAESSSACTTHDWLLPRPSGLTAAAAPNGRPGSPRLRGSAASAEYRSGDTLCTACSSCTVCAVRDAGAHARSVTQPMTQSRTCSVRDSVHDSADSARDSAGRLIRQERGGEAQRVSSARFIAGASSVTTAGAPVCCVHTRVQLTYTRETHFKACNVPLAIPR